MIICGKGFEHAGSGLGSYTDTPLHTGHCRGWSAHNRQAAWSAEGRKHTKRNTGVKPVKYRFFPDFQNQPRPGARLTQMLRIWGIRRILPSLEDHASAEDNQDQRLRGFMLFVCFVCSKACHLQHILHKITCQSQVVMKAGLLEKYM